MSKHSAIPPSSSASSTSVVLADVRLTNLSPDGSKPALQRWLKQLLSAVRWQALRTSPERPPFRDVHIKVVPADLEEALSLLRSRQFKARQLAAEETASSRMDRAGLRFYITNVSLRTSAAQLEQHVAQLTGFSPIAVSIHNGTGQHAGVSNFAFVGMPALAKEQVGRVQGSHLNERRLLCKLSDDRSYIPGRSGVSSQPYRGPGPPRLPRAAEKTAPPPTPPPPAASEVEEPLSPEEPSQPLAAPVSPVSVATESSSRPLSASSSVNSTCSTASSSSSEPTPSGGVQYAPPAEDSEAAAYPSAMPVVPVKNLAEYASAASELSRVFTALAELDAQRSALVAQRLDCDAEIERLQGVSRTLREAESRCLQQVDRLQRHHAQLSEFLFGKEFAHPAECPTAPSDWRSAPFASPIRAP